MGFARPRWLRRWLWRAQHCEHCLGICHPGGLDQRRMWCRQMLGGMISYGNSYGFNGTIFPGVSTYKSNIVKLSADWRPRVRLHPIQPLFHAFPMGVLWFQTLRSITRSMSLRPKFLPRANGSRDSQDRSWTPGEGDAKRYTNHTYLSICTSYWDEHVCVHRKCIPFFPLFQIERTRL